MSSPSSDGPLVQRAARRICLLILLTLASAVLRAQIQEPDTHANTIYGTVLNSVTHEPIGRALVSSRDNRLATLTDGEGHFEFELPRQEERDPQNPPSIAWLTARKPGFLENQNPDVQAAATLGHEITLWLAPEGIIKGRITFPRGGRSGRSHCFAVCQECAGRNSSMGATQWRAGELQRRIPLRRPSAGRLQGRHKRVIG